MESKQLFEFIGIKVQQPLGEFFVGKIEGRKLSHMSIAEVRDLEQSDIEQRIGIQRELDSKKVKEIAEYVKTSDACFPNSVILSVKSKFIQNIEDLDRENDVFKISLEMCNETFQIIDGQHRIAGLENYNEEKEFFINVSLFLDMDPEQQGILFATINSKQKGVNKSLMMDLHTMQSVRNPIKSAHYIGRILNRDDVSALRGRIAPFYTPPKSGGYKYTLATFINKVVKYISGNDVQLLKDRDALKVEKPLIYANENNRKKLIFRNLFIDEQDESIAIILNNYFSAVDKCWHSAWNEEGYVLARTIGFNALMKVLPLVVEEIGLYDQIISVEQFEDVLAKTGIDVSEFKEDKFNLSGYGQSELVRLLEGGLRK